MNYSICTYMTKMRHKSRQKVRFFANFRVSKKTFWRKNKPLQIRFQQSPMTKTVFMLSKTNFLRQNRPNAHRIEEFTTLEKKHSSLTK
jgi:hypothetical protein